MSVELVMPSIITISNFWSRGSRILKLHIFLVWCFLLGHWFVPASFNPLEGLSYIGSGIGHMTLLWSVGQFPVVKAEAWRSVAHWDIPSYCSWSREQPYEQVCASLWDEWDPWLALFLYYPSWQSKSRATKLTCSWLKTHNEVQLRTAELPSWAQPKLPTHRTMSYFNGCCIKPLSFWVVCFRA